MATIVSERPTAEERPALPRTTGKLPVGQIAANLLDALATSDLIFLASDEPRALELVQALEGGAPEAMILFCPGSDALPGDSAPPSPSNVGQRATALRKLRAALQEPLRSRPKIALVSTGEAAARLYPRPESFEGMPPVVHDGQPLDLESFAAELESVGYVPDDRVDEPGEIALRGQVIDVFPADAGEPYRIEVQDGEVVGIRPYDPATQLTSGECETLELGRVNEPDLGEGVTLLDHLPAAPVALDSGAEKRRVRFLDLARDAGKRRPKRALRDVCPEERWEGAIRDREELELPGALDGPPRFVEMRAPIRAFTKFAGDALSIGDRVLLLGTERDLRFLARRVPKALKSEPRTVASWADARVAEPGSLLMLCMPVQRGFRVEGLVAIAAADLLGSRAQRDGDQPAGGDAHLLEVGGIRLGDVVVHEDHGISVVAGLQELPEDGGDAIVLRFAAEGRRLVPVAEADKLWRYGADEDAVTLDKLDGTTWEKRRGEIAASVAETARGLVRIAAERLEQSAPVLEPETAAYERFSAGFPFTETNDQTRSIEAVRGDLASGKPMDRLLIGDVGYGKTEVALRAAAVAALSGKQVAVAAPTTVLARQHLETFRERFEGTGVEVAGLSRLTSASEKKRVAAGVKDGSISIVVGTGAIAGKTVAYKGLALVIIDEEQRFGAADKAKLRGLGAGHVLTLSATPIPRTLQSALIGLQQLSVIATPPARRQPIRTTVGGFEDQTVRTALLRERSRGGQGFLVVPRIEDIDPMAERLARLVPELELLQAHGKLPAAEIDEVMVRFAAGDGDVLLATNIIEAGLDVPRANTMFVWKADRFGLSQLHQLRGRVGRGARRGQVYLLTDPDASIAPRTLARLNTLQAFDRLGAGFAISARDLDMRGAGDLLSDEQTGHVKLIGVDLYQHLLEAAIRRARGETVDDWRPLLNLGVGGRLPADWIPEEDLRIEMYDRLARISDLAGLGSFEEELEDRFGELPDDAQSLLAIARVQLLARAAGIAKIDAGPAAVAFTARGNLRLESPDLVEKDGRLLLMETIEQPLERLQRIEAVLLDLVA